MRAVDRGNEPAPKGLSKTDDIGKTEFDRALANFALPKPDAFEFKAYKDEEVSRRLETLFHGKCAYCESYYSSTAPVDIEHFRPKGAIEGQTGPGYWWLAMEWTNLLPSCIDCNRRRKQITPTSTTDLLSMFDRQLREAKMRPVLSGKKDAFPIAGTRVLWEQPKPNGVPPSLAGERPLLLNPCFDKPEEHLVFHNDPDALISLVLPVGKTAAAASAEQLPAVSVAPGVATDGTARKLSERGAVSIQVYGLNRLGLVQARTRVLRHLDFLSELVLDMLDLAETHAGTLEEQNPGAAARDPIVKGLNHLAGRILDEMKNLAKPEQPYSAVAQEWLRHFEIKLEG
ncbi:hypothetical protein NKI61_10060 [Mesorhizobium sp. M0514]|uniref:hypothetical protein n=1 Tax=Mesorhizobium sp. M0514 TaxID=2956955 RepID=UPI0033359DA6